MTIVRCSCVHPYQDSLYGHGNRVTTPMRTGQYKCTVCGTVHGSQSLTKSVAKAPVIAPEAKSKPAEKPKVEKAKPAEKKAPEKKADKPEKKKSMKGGKR